jgi:hypothetical protein
MEEPLFENKKHQMEKSKDINPKEISAEERVRVNHENSKR